MKNRKVILITGAGSGLGALIANELSQGNYSIYGTYNSKAPKNASDIRYLKLDITSDYECKKVVENIIRKEKRIDVIINNAGFTLSGPTLNFSVEDFQKLLETNVIGPFRLMKLLYSKSVMPSLVINITSLNGFLSLPNFGIYSSSKHAMEALGLALRYELAPQTKVVNVTPGALSSGKPIKMAHKTAREKFAVLNWIIPLTPQNKAAKIIANLVGQPNVPRRVIIGRDAQIINLMQRVLPNFIFDWIIFRIWNKK